MLLLRPTEKERELFDLGVPARQLCYMRLKFRTPKALAGALERFHSNGSWQIITQEGGWYDATVDACIDNPGGASE